MCGIFGWTGKDPKKFNSIKFNVLGNYNDTRGGDSCGVYYNNGCVKGLDKESKYKDLVYNHELHTRIKLKEPLVIGHTRKASVGGITISNIQPLTLANEAGDIVYVQAHNGTIHNFEEMAEKYKIKLDSLVLYNGMDEEFITLLPHYLNAHKSWTAALSGYSIEEMTRLSNAYTQYEQGNSELDKMKQNLETIENEAEKAKLQLEIDLKRLSISGFS
jgi:glutamine phosphoribosylpyrophosphate amidotransferase